MSDDVTITENELLAEYDKLDAMRIKLTEPLLTEEQFKLIKHARSGSNPVIWSKLAEYFESRGWGKVPITTLKSRYQIECARRA